LIKLLILFVEHPGELVLREEIAACLWDQPEAVDVANGINTAVNRLRAALGDDPAKPEYVETVVRLGYRFICEVELGEKPGPEPVSLATSSGGPAPAQDQAGEQNKSSAEGEESRQTRRGLSWWALSAVLTLMLVSVVLVSLRFVHRSKHLEPAAGPTFSGGAFRQVTFNEGADRVGTAAISHQGTKVAFSNRDGLSVRDLSSSVSQMLPTPAGLKITRIGWYPGDAQLVISGTSDSTGAAEVWLTQVDASAPRLLMENAEDAVPSLDGKRLAFIRRREVWIGGVFGEARES
jgi:DNA-binding winged helix-turn-helix (wHTH) protein